MIKILIVEDDKLLAKGIKISLEKLYSIDISYTYKDAITMLNNNNYDLVILDINLPDGNGIDILKFIKNNTNCPSILITANDLEKDIIYGFDMGADDYITKPFSLNILRVRVKNQLKNLYSCNYNVYKTKNLYFNFQDLTFSKNSVSFSLNKVEQRLLKILINNKGIILKREILIDKVWTTENEFVYDNALSVAIKRLRDKIEDDPKNPKLIETIYGIGYRWNKDDEIF